MKTVTIILTKKDAKEALRFYQFWTLLFLILIIIGNYYKLGFTIGVSIGGIILALILLYFNRRYLKVKGNIVSKSITDINSVENALLYYKIFIILWVIFIVFLLFLGGFDKTLSCIFLIFPIMIFYRRLKFTASFLKKK